MDDLTPSPSPARRGGHEDPVSPLRAGEGLGVRSPEWEHDACE